MSWVPDVDSRNYGIVQKFLAGDNVLADKLISHILLCHMPLEPWR